MNKLLIFPLAVMFILTVFASTWTGAHYTGTSPDYSNPGQATYNANGTPTTGSVDIPNGGAHTFDIWSIAGAVVILTIAIAVGIIAGIKIFGSGLSDTSQKLIFNSVLFLGLWACLTVISSMFLFASPILWVFWFALTMMYIIGFGIQASGNTMGAG